MGKKQEDKKEKYKIFDIFYGLKKFQSKNYKIKFKNKLMEFLAKIFSILRWLV